ncbi:hypothetical protein ABNQ38_21300 [Azospirillum sp. A29]|uniref:hypothetical protein n=1 Tax=Azospirillum sp. A29 TaxID=3160606 RepID=UPI00366E0D25
MAFSIDADIRMPGYGGRRAVIADADRVQREALAGHLSSRGFQVSQTDDALEARPSSVRRRRPWPCFR